MVLCASSSRTGNPACLHNTHQLLVQCAMCNSTSCSHRGTSIQHARHDKAGRNCTKYNCIRNPDVQYFLSPNLFCKQCIMLKHDDILLAGPAPHRTASIYNQPSFQNSVFKQRNCISYNCIRNLDINFFLKHFKHLGAAPRTTADGFLLALQCIVCFKT